MLCCGWSTSYGEVQSCAELTAGTADTSSPLGQLAKLSRKAGSRRESKSKSMGGVWVLMFMLSSNMKLLVWEACGSCEEAKRSSKSEDLPVTTEDEVEF